MGNNVCCVSSKVPSNVVKVIVLYGCVHEFEKPIKAAELMLDNPQHFVCHSTAMQRGQRISALSADEELELGFLYFLLPMHKLYSPLSPSEIASLAFKADSALHKSSSKSRGIARILPVLGDLCHCPTDRELSTMNGGDNWSAEINSGKETARDKDIVMPKLQVDDADELEEVRGLRMRMRRRYWKPVLETISESPRPIERRLLPSSSPLLYITLNNRLSHRSRPSDT